MKITVCGAGNSAMGMAADMAFMGHEVNMFELSKFEANLIPIKEQGGIILNGPSQSGKNGFAALAEVTSDPSIAFKGVELIMFALPCFGHEAFMEVITPHLEDGQIMVFNTGYWASIRFQQLLKKHKKKVTLAETSLHVYLCRKTGPAEATVDAVKQKMLFCAMPSNKTEAVLAKLKPIYPQFVAAKQFFEIHFNNFNHMVHGPIALLNTGQIENLNEKPYYFYRDGATPRVCKVAEAIDKERLAVAEAAKVETKSILEVQTEMYGHMGAVGDTIYEAIKGNKADHSFNFDPASFVFGLAKEDVPYGFIPLISIGEKLGVDCTMMKSIVNLQCAVCDTDFWTQGMTMEKLGFNGMSIDQIKEYLETGEK
ncbi:NAD/NADP octopine/nopaline dehydrogenase family protein [Desulfobacula sp.]|uniref:NAD/NADP octopine/nopaline dehydrogenase family protein n=1 Tax=Desulfobacula sp. TaxID=2593537 RepID=UPI00262EDE08|nr:NAD/NADP octopine/nopaline dehydrogenase family protein [Desulfobacula sp.]